MCCRVPALAERIAAVIDARLALEAAEVLDAAWHWSL